MVRNFVRDAAITWRYGGPPQAWDALGRRVIRRVCTRERALLLEDDLATPLPPAPDADLQIRSFADRDRRLIGRAVTTRMLDRFDLTAAPGRTCLVAWRGTRPVGYTWVTESGALPASLPMKLPPDATYSWGLWVDPRERGRGVGSALVRARLARSRERGYRRSWRLVMAGNRPALRAGEKASGGRSRVLGTVTYRALLGRRRMRYEPIGPARA